MWGFYAFTEKAERPEREEESRVLGGRFGSEAAVAAGAVLHSCVFGTEEEYASRTGNTPVRPALRGDGRHMRVNAALLLRIKRCRRHLMRGNRPLLRRKATSSSLYWPSARPHVRFSKVRPYIFGVRLLQSSVESGTPHTSPLHPTHYSSPRPRHRRRHAPLSTCAMI